MADDGDGDDVIVRKVPGMMMMMVIVSLTVVKLRNVVCVYVSMNSEV